MIQNMEFKFNINEIFYSIQGEGFWAGTPMLFVRFSGCNLQCPWCDTLHEKINARLSISELIKRISSHLTKHKIRRVCLTGGEPTAQIGFDSLVDRLRQIGIMVHVETNGTVPMYSTPNWLTASPKRQNKFKINTRKIPNEVKLIVDGEFSKRDIPPISELSTLYFQPEWGNAKAMKKAVALVKSGKGKLSLQMHKYANFK